jgi:RNA polymerase sigma factor (sigma-70 family)
VEDRHGLEPLLERVLRDRDHTSDPEAWNRLMERVRLIVRAELLFQVRQAADASDLAQEVQRSILASFPRFRGETVPSLLCWVEKIAANVLCNYWRRRPPPDSLEEIECEPVAPVPDVEAFDSDLIGQVIQMLEQLPDPGREIVRTFYLEGISCAEIARRMNRTPEWVRLTKMYAVRELKKRLGGTV